MTDLQKLAATLAVAGIIVAVVLFMGSEPADDQELPDSPGLEDHQPSSPSSQAQPARESESTAPQVTAPDETTLEAPGEKRDASTDNGDDEVPRAPEELSITIDDLGEAVGPAQWLAQPHDVDVDELEEELNRGAMEQEFLIAKRRDRHRSIEVVEPVVHDCYGAWRARGIDAEIVTQGIDDSRVALGWNMITDAGRGRLENPQILHQLGPRDERFEACLIDGLDGLGFDAVGDGADLEVQWAVQPN
jgi:hypothetical protein